MIDWIAITDDPLDAGVRKDIEVFLRGISSVIDINLEEYFSTAAAERTVLHIGCCEHSPKYMSATGWKHRAMADVASRIVGVDINEPAVDEMRKMGYEVVCADATGDTNLDELFDRVIIGDVIEHVGNLQGLMEFSGRHLAPDAELIISTPNPFFIRHVLRAWLTRPMVANFEHVSWVTESNILELARRSGLILKAIHYPVGNAFQSRFKSFAKRVSYRFLGTALFTANIYVLGKVE